MAQREFDHDPSAVTQAREAAGLNKSALARQLGCSRSLITEIEGGTRNAREELLIQMAKVLKVPADRLRRKGAADESGGQAAETANVGVRPLRHEERTGTEDLSELRQLGGS